MGTLLGLPTQYKVPFLFVCSQVQKFSFLGELESFILGKFIITSQRMCLEFLWWLALSLEGEYLKVAELMLLLVWLMAEFVNEPHIQC